jgi:Tfp pilus assembly protein PilN
VSTQTELTAGVAAMPRVNLMPPEIAEADRFRRLQLAMGSAVVLAAVVVGGLYFHAKSGISSAQAEVDTAQSQQVALQAQLAKLASVKQTFAEVQAKQQLLQQAMGQEIRWSYMLNDLSLRMPNNVWLTAIQATENVGGTASTSSSALPGSSTDTIGTIAFSGMGMKHDDVANWLDSLARERGLTDPTFQNSTETAIGQTGVVQFTSTAQIGPKAYSNRYTPKAGS